MTNITVKVDSGLFLTVATLLTTAFTFACGHRNGNNDTAGPSVRGSTSAENELQMTTGVPLRDDYTSTSASMFRSMFRSADRLGLPSILDLGGYSHAFDESDIVDGASEVDTAEQESTIDARSEDQENLCVQDVSPIYGDNDQMVIVEISNQSWLKSVSMIISPWLSSAFNMSGQCIAPIDVFRQIEMSPNRSLYLSHLTSESNGLTGAELHCMLGSRSSIHEKFLQTIEWLVKREMKICGCLLSREPSNLF